MSEYNDYKQILTKFKQLLLETFGANPLSFVLFGSVARGAAKQESDIDLLIILKDAPDSYYRRLELSSKKVALEDKTWYWNLKRQRAVENY